MSSNSPVDHEGTEPFAHTKLATTTEDDNLERVAHSVIEVPVDPATTEQHNGTQEDECRQSSAIDDQIATTAGGGAQDRCEEHVALSVVAASQCQGPESGGSRNETSEPFPPSDVREKPRSVCKTAMWLVVLFLVFFLLFILGCIYTALRIAWFVLSHVGYFVRLLGYLVYNVKSKKGKSACAVVAVRTVIGGAIWLVGLVPSLTAGVIWFLAIPPGYGVRRLHYLLFQEDEEESWIQRTIKDFESIWSLWILVESTEATKVYSND